jgi:hypothetical protein
MASIIQPSWVKSINQLGFNSLRSILRVRIYLILAVLWVTKRMIGCINI